MSRTAAEALRRSFPALLATEPPQIKRAMREFQNLDPGHQGFIQTWLSAQTLVLLDELVGGGMGDGDDAETDDAETDDAETDDADDAPVDADADEGDTDDGDAGADEEAPYAEETPAEAAAPVAAADARAAEGAPGGAPDPADAPDAPDAPDAIAKDILSGFFQSLGDAQPEIQQAVARQMRAFAERLGA